MRKYNLEIINHINLFENITKARVKDCFTDDKGKFIFIIEKGDLGKAIGKNAVNIKRLEDMLKKRIKVVGFDDDVIKFVANYIYPLKAESITMDNNLIKIKANGVSTKSLLIGRDSRNIGMLKKVVKKYFNIDGIFIL